MTRVSFQGERGAYSEAAAITFFKNNIKTIPLSTFAQILESTINEKTDYSILPVENSIEGSVGESYDLLYSTTLNVVGETYHKIEHCLIGSGKLEEVDTVYSHPQALGQCRKFIQSHNMKTVPTYDTAGSVEIIKSLGPKKNNIACIASKQASQIHQLPIIENSIADNTNNYTRFLILANQKFDEPHSNKTSIIFSIKHEKDALYNIMKKFHENQINLTKIESRPTKTTAWEYNFYVDFEGGISEHEVRNTIEKIKKETLFFKNLGSYKTANSTKS